MTRCAFSMLVERFCRYRTNKKSIPSVTSLGSEIPNGCFPAKCSMITLFAMIVNPDHRTPYAHHQNLVGHSLQPKHFDLDSMPKLQSYDQTPRWTIIQFVMMIVVG